MCWRGTKVRGSPARAAGLDANQPGNRYLCFTGATAVWAQVNRCLDRIWGMNPLVLLDEIRCPQCWEGGGVGDGSGDALGGGGEECVGGIGFQEAYCVFFSSPL